MQLLQLTEGCNDVGLLGECLGLCAEHCLGLKVLLEIVFAELVVNLQHVIELLAEQLVLFPQWCYLALWYVLDFFPCCLHCAELVYLGGALRCLVYKFLQLVEELQFLLKVILHLFFLCSQPCVALCLYLAKVLFECLFKLVGLWYKECFLAALGNVLLDGCFNLSCAHAVELYLECLDLGLAVERIVAFSNSLETLDDFLTACRSCYFGFDCCILY